MFKDVIHRAKPWESPVRKVQQQLNRRRGSLVFNLNSGGPSDVDDPSSSASPLPSPLTPTPPLPPASPPLTSSLSQQPCTSTSGGGRDTDDSSVHHVERLLPNGDFYTGQWRGNAPHGTGKYLWTDGCMYEGDWRNGKTMGKGKFSWPSGATYEGDFKSGFMDGFGTYTGALGDTYRGSWAMNLKHGHGKKSYANGDYYDGEWRSGIQDGHGRYSWRNGNEYVGDWRSGTISGHGMLIWNNGNRYEGGWEDGQPKGNGSFRWADGGLYVGQWSTEPEGTLQQTGVYYPSPASSSPTARNPDEAFAADLRDCTVCPADNVSVLPSQKTLNWHGVQAEFLQKQAAWRSSKSWDTLSRRRASMDTRAPSTGSTPTRFSGHANTVIGTGSNTGGGSFWDSDGEIAFDAENGFTVSAGIPSADQGASGESIGGLRPEEAEPRGPGRFHQMLKSLPKEVKKQGETISKGHKNYELMLNLQLGIRHAVGRQAEPTTFDLKASAFDPKEKIWTRFPTEGSKQTPPHQSCEFKWKDYCPLVFRTLRKLFKVDPADYMISICGNDALRELSSPGKSGSFFYLTNDDKYMIKTMKKSEVKVLIRMLPAYYNHVRAFENCLVTKFFGLHSVKLTGPAQRKVRTVHLTDQVRFVIMGNLFCTEYIIHRRFDLKGSSHGRITDKPETEIDETTTLKDLDLNFIFRLQKSWFQEFRRQVDKDCDFLEQERIMDYSLLVGVYFCETTASQDAHGNNDAANTTEKTPRLSRANMDKFLSDPARWASINLGSNMPARVELIERKSDVESTFIGEPTGEFYDVILYFGIIDILQDYDISKKLEHAYKSIQYDPTAISAVDPRLYSKRFRDFVFKCFTEDV